MEAPVLVVDPDPRHRRFLDGALRHGGFRVESVATGEEAVDLAHRELPQLVLLEVQLDGISGYEVCRALREEYGATLSIVFLSGDRCEPCDREAGLLLGADEHLGKPLSRGELLARIRSLQRRSRRRDPRRRGSGSRDDLTDRELEVLGLLADGLTPAMIAERLFVTPKTVAKHLEHILMKLGVHSRAEAVAAAYRRGLHSVNEKGLP
ncbi:MAG: response regulator transcription factor [Thermoleophilaceae bacterium]